ncbi:hypothetical protein RRG08_008651 [Elysia crispata]|uniref:Uncharacterized protein n=1 Tax=Elysia crispata TaxID=231223 RepID=A0AAE1A8C8_9GAST|nr:hypothetical protein RRG08_008651 [Elysia crispata]
MLHVDIVRPHVRYLAGQLGSEPTEQEDLYIRTKSPASPDFPETIGSEKSSAEWAQSQSWLNFLCVCIVVLASLLPSMENHS